MSSSLSIYRSIYLPIFLSICLSICMSIYPSTFLPIKNEANLQDFPIFQTGNIKNPAIMRSFLKFWAWQRQKRSNSSRLPQFLHFTTSKTKKFCETSSFFEGDNIKNEAILRDFLQKWKVECRADGLVPMRFAIFNSICLRFFIPSVPMRLCACHESEARSYEVSHPSRKIILANLKIWRSKMQPSQEIRAQTS